MSVKKVMIAGAGTLGSQISWQTAVSGFEVCVYDAFEQGLDACKVFHKQYAEHFMAERGASQSDVDQAFQRLSYTTDLARAAADADMLSESVPEAVDVKIEFYGALSKVAPEKMIFTTNTSTLLPSQFAEATGRPAQFLALHFGNPIWDANIGEVMRHPDTDNDVFEQVIKFAGDIGMVPIRLEKEQNGYLINSLLVPWFIAAQTSVSNGIANHSDVDRTWMICSHMDKGPFGLMDLVGLETVYMVMQHWASVRNDEQLQKNADYIKSNFVDTNKLGEKTGEGYYQYPNPSYQSTDFLTSG